jgi:hypothetical protein
MTETSRQVMMQQMLIGFQSQTYPSWPSITKLSLVSLKNTIRIYGIAKIFRDSD